MTSLADVFESRARYVVVPSDCRFAMSCMPAESVDAIVTDPPYGLSSPPHMELVLRRWLEGDDYEHHSAGFMNKDWDAFVPGPNYWREVFRVLKPGGHAIVFAGTRTVDLMGLALRLARFEIRDSLAWVYAQGFPKSVNVSGGVREKGLACVCDEAVRDLRDAVDTEDEVPIVKEQDLRTELHQASTVSCQVWATKVAADGVPRLRRELFPDGKEGRDTSSDKVLQSPMLGEAADGALAHNSPAVDSGSVGRGDGAAHAPHAGTLQSGMERGRDVLTEEGQLQADQIRAVSGGVHRDGAQGRLRNGAPSVHGADGRARVVADGSGASRRPRSAKQRADQSGAVAGQPQPQARGAWPLCRRCGKPVVPSGIGTALKPAFEPVIVARKPLDGTVAANFLKYGTGALNIDGCRIACSPEDFAELQAGVEAIRARGGSMENSWKNSSDLSGANPASTLGRWPANVALGHADGCELFGTKRVRNASGNINGASAEARRDSGHIFGTDARARGPWQKHADADGNETVEAWRCVPGCPVAELDAQSGDRPGMSGGGVHRADYAGGMFGAIDCPGVARGDAGGASRFFFTAKAPRSERDAGLDEFAAMTGAQATSSKEGQARLNSPRTGAGRGGGARNSHPTVKPVDLMRWLVRLVTRPGSLVLDPFCGSGTTGVATMLEGDGRRFVGLELEPLHVDFARARIAHVVGGGFEREVPERAAPRADKQEVLFR